MHSCYSNRAQETTNRWNLNLLHLQLSSHFASVEPFQTRKSTDKEQKMFRTTGTNSTMVHPCRTMKTPFVPLIFIFLIFPFHVLMMKIMAKNLHFALPRHSILFSLCLSDGIQIFVAIVIGAVHAGSAITEEGIACQFVKGTMIFAAIFTLFVTCVAIISLSIERYVACIHSFRLHLTFTEARVRYGSIVTWVMAAAIATISLVARKNHHIQETITDSSVKITSVVFIFPTSLIVTILQSKLYLFSRKKLKEVAPRQAFGVQLELADYRKKHVKVAAVAGIVAFAFVFCMMPFASISLYEMVTGATVSASVRTICGYFALSNTVLDPFLYGFGMTDTRKKIFGEVNKAREYLVERVTAKFTIPRPL